MFPKQYFFLLSASFVFSMICLYLYDLLVFKPNNKLNLVRIEKMDPRHNETPSFDA